MARKLQNRARIALVWVSDMLQRRSIACSSASATSCKIEVLNVILSAVVVDNPGCGADGLEGKRLSTQATHAAQSLSCFFLAAVSLP